MCVCVCVCVYAYIYIHLSAVLAQTYVFALFDFEVRRRNKMINPIDLERYEELEALTDNALKLLKVYAQQAARGDLPMPGPPF